jgi:hypothetical protein
MEPGARATHGSAAGPGADVAAALDDEERAEQRRRERRWIATTLVAAVLVPGVAARYLGGRVHGALAPALTELTAQPVSIDHVEVGLTGTIRIVDVEVGDVFAADAIEASVALDHLLSGDVGADEVQIEGPRVRAHVDGAGDSDLARLVRRVAARRGPARGSGAAPGRLRRIVVTDGALVIDVVGRGRLIADEVELSPEAGGVRVVTGPVTVTGSAGPMDVRARFARAAADVALPTAAVPRLVAIDGAIEVGDQRGGPRLVLRDATVGRDLYGGGAITLAAQALDDGVPRPVAIVALPGGPGELAVQVRGAGVPLAAFAGFAPAAIGLAGAHASGTATIARAHGASRVALAIDVDGAVVRADALAEVPVPFAGGAALTATIAGDDIAIDDAALTTGALTVRAHGRLRRGGLAGVRAGDVALEVARAPCLAQLEALPAVLRGPVDGLALAGVASATGRVRFDLDLPPGQAVQLDADVDVADCQVLGEAPGADPRTLAGVAMHTFPDGSRALVGPGQGDWVELADLPAHVDGAFRAAEDGRFYDHGGFDPLQIARSLEVDLREGRFARGGSTISQQLVKNAFLSQARTASRKLDEAILTWRLEATLSKQTILARYLNVIELGPGVFGVAAAAQYWFGKPATELDVKEAALLAAMTSAPRTMSRRLIAAGGLDDESAERVDTVLRAMKRDGVIDKDEYERARDERIVLRKDVIAAAITR